MLRSEPRRRVELAEDISVSLQIKDGWAIVRVAGDLDLNTAPILERRLGLAAVLTEPPRVAVELSKVDFCDSSGIGLLVRIWQRLRAAGGQLVLVRPPWHLRRLLHWTGLERFLSIRDSLPAPVPVA